MKKAIVTAASRLSSLDSHGTPKCLIQVGERALIHQVLQQLSKAKIEEVVITLGYKAKEIQDYLLSNNVFPHMSLHFVTISESVWAARGHAAALLEVRNFFKTDEPFLIVPADHIFQPEIMQRMVGCFSSPSSFEAFALVEEDMEGMVGLPGSSYKVSLDSESLEILSIHSLSTVSENPKEIEALFAGVLAAKPTFWDYLEQVAKSKPYFTVSEALTLMKDKKLLKAVPTSGDTWFSIETPESLGYALSKHDNLDSSSWFRKQSTRTARITVNSDYKKEISIVPSGRSSSKKTLNNGGDWDEFEVDKWRSAVFTQGEFFTQLYADTNEFAREVLQKLSSGKEELFDERGVKRAKQEGISEGVSLIEVGSGTGEFVLPMAPFATYSLGIDINPKFVDWSQKRIPKELEGKVDFKVGDASQLVKFCKEEGPEILWKTRRVVCCVGNTMGILPEEIKWKCFQQMFELAGPDGYVFVVFWNARIFPDAIKNFYGKNHQLCGPFDESHVNYQTATLQTPSGYRTHWTSEEEAKGLLKKYGYDEVFVQEKGRGVILLARKSS